ncbi:MAG: prepilin peptidase [Candidatus Scatovivens sp.]
MYINNINILYYLIFGILGLIVGEISLWCNYRMVEEKSIFSKEFFKQNNIKKDYKYIILTLNIFLYIGILYKFGIKNSFYSNLDLIKFLILVPMLISAFFIDLKHRIIPNRLNMTIFEIGLAFTFIYGINNVNIAKDMILGMFVGGGIFLLITLLGGLIAGKEAMGLGDVKLMGALGLFFGATSIAEISLLAFFIGAIASIFIIIIRKFVLKINDEYIAFGPFLTISALICMFIPANSIFYLFLSLCEGISKLIIN